MKSMKFKMRNKYLNPENVARRGKTIEIHEGLSELIHMNEVFMHHYY